MAGGTAEIIKEKLDIVEFLKGYITLVPAGKNFKAVCPFHREKSPSFMVSPDRQSWHCFGCASHGDIFTFIMRYENIEFGEALRILAEKAGVELKQLNPAEYKFAGLLYDLNFAAKDFFKNALKQSPVARKYIEDRKLNDNTVEEFELGFAPQEREALCLHFLKLGFRPEDIIQAGLAIRTDRGLLLDRFRGRIMFPIHNHSGKVVGFTGRILPQFDTGEMGKYVNSPESPIFNKSKLLYGFFLSKNFIREEKSVFLVEGQMDFLMSWQAGIRTVVASSGTALTEDHLRTLRRLAETLVVSFDSDDAGREAGERAIDLAEANDFEVKVVTFKDVKDPADAVAAGPGILEGAIKNAKSAQEFYFEKYLPKGQADPGNREDIRAVRAILKKIKTIASPISEEHWMHKLSEYSGLSEKALREEAEKIEVVEAKIKKEEAIEKLPEIALSRKERIEMRLLGAAYAVGTFDMLVDMLDHIGREHAAIYELLRRGEKSHADPRIDALLNIVILKSEPAGEGEIEALKSELSDEYIKERRQALTDTIRRAEQKGDDAALAHALSELNALSATLREK